MVGGAYKAWVQLEWLVYTKQQNYYYYYYNNIQYLHNTHSSAAVVDVLSGKCMISGKRFLLSIKFFSQEEK